MLGTSKANERSLWCIDNDEAAANVDLKGILTVPCTPVPWSSLNFVECHSFLSLWQTGCVCAWKAY